MGSGAADSPAKVESGRPGPSTPPRRPQPSKKAAAGRDRESAPAAGENFCHRSARAAAFDRRRLAIRKWFQNLMQPAVPTMSCCGEADAYWADSYEVEGDHYVAIITDERPDGPLARAHIDVGTRIIVPNAKIKWDQGNPTGHGVIFLRSDDKWVYCYAPPGGV